MYSRVSLKRILEALKKENVLRNRYSNVFPWDKTRVVLPILPGAKSDYINASSILHSESTTSPYASSR